MDMVALTETWLSQDYSGPTGIVCGEMAYTGYILSASDYRQICSSHRQALAKLIHSAKTIISVFFIALTSRLLVEIKNYSSEL